MKIKVVQIISDPDGNFYYLDSKGRVWYDGGHAEQHRQPETNVLTSRWVTKWEQVDLPEAPKL